MYSLHDEEDDNADERETDQSSRGSTLMQRIAGAHQQTRTDDACEYFNQQQVHKTMRAQAHLQ